MNKDTIKAVGTGFALVFLGLICGFVIGVAFMDADFDITLDDNARIAIEEISDSLESVEIIRCKERLIYCKDQLRNETIDKMKLTNMLDEEIFENQRGRD